MSALPPRLRPGSGRSLDQHALAFAALETTTAPAFGAPFKSNLQGLPPLSVHTGNLISVGYCANSLASTRQHWVQMPDTVVTIFDSSGNLPPNLGAGGPGRPMFSSTSGAAAKTSSVLSALTAYWKYPSLCKTENLTSKKYLSNVQGVEVMGLFIVKAAGLPC